MSRPRKNRSGFAISSAPRQPFSGPASGAPGDRTDGDLCLRIGAGRELAGSLGGGAPLVAPLADHIGAGLADLGFLANGFSRDPNVLALRTLRQELERLQRAQKAAEQQRRAAERGQAKVEGDYDRELQRLGRARTENSPRSHCGDAL